MKVSGPEPYRSLIDPEKLTAFFLTNGLPLEQTANIRVSFLDGDPFAAVFFFFMGKPMGKFVSGKRPGIELYWREFEKIPEVQKRLEMLNEVVLHEAIHLCEMSTRKGKFVFAAQMVLTVACAILLNGLLWLILRNLPFPWSGVIDFALQIPCYIGITKILYRFSPTEKSARTPEKLSSWVLCVPQEEVEH